MQSKRDLALKMEFKKVEQTRLDTDIVGVPIKLNQSPETKKQIGLKSSELKKTKKRDSTHDVESLRSKVK